MLLGSWPKSMLFLSMLCAGGALGWWLWRGKARLAPSVRGVRLATIWALEFLTVALLLLLLWEPALSVTALKPQQNIVAVVIDDSRSMDLADTGKQREQQAIDLLRDGLLRKLSQRFQVRIYKLGKGINRIQDTSELRAQEGASQIGKGLRQLAEEAGTVPIGSVVLLSDGADTTGGIDLQTMEALRRRQLPVNTIGFGNPELSKDIEMEGFDIPTKALPDSRIEAQITIRQNGFSGAHANLVLTSGGSVLATRDMLLKNGPEQVETVEFNAGKNGVREIEAKIEPLPGETNTANNSLRDVLSIDTVKKRILYVEGEPRWEFKFVRRAVEDDPALEIVSMLRTTQNKIYRQGISNPKELEDGFPTKPEDLFEYQGIILGSVESAFFSAVQKQEMKDFVDRRGGGMLFLGGRYSLADGGYDVAPFSELLPVNLPTRKDTFHRDFAAAELTDPGKASLVCRIENTPEKSKDHWEVLPYLANYQDPGTPKPGAVVLARADAGGKRIPLLITENYGRGRTAVFATGGSWRWRMQQPVGDKSQETFWRQLLRWVAGSTPSSVIASTPTMRVEDEAEVEVRAEVRDKAYLPVSNAQVTANVIAPDASSQTVTLRPDPVREGMYFSTVPAPLQGSYVAEVSAARDDRSLGKDVAVFRREDGIAENFHREQNRELLEKLADQTGGHYYTPGDAERLSHDIAYSEAGITSREIRDLWDMPIVFFLLIVLRSSEWVLRRHWGVV